MGTDKQLFEQLNKLCGSATMIVGIGSTLKGDDGAGPLVCERLAGKVSAELIDAGTVPENYIQSIIKKAPQNFSIISTHTLSPRIFVDMIRSQLDVEVYFIGIQPAQTALGQPISAQVKRAVQQLSNLLTKIFPRRD
jgi:Ni,Fe-hydrogenase maturation factor